MFLSQSTLAQRLVYLLAAAPDQQARDLWIGARRGSRSFSVAAIYKELTKLQALGIVVKQRTRYSLSYTWIAESQQFIERVSHRYQQPDYLSSFIPGAVGKHTWRFRSLLDMDDFWNQILLALVSQDRGERVFSWVPHPWFVLIHTEKERKFHSALHARGKKFFTIFGDDGFLDRLAERLYPRDIHDYAFAPAPFHREQSSYFDVVGEFLLTVRIEEPLTRAIERLFCSVRTKRDLDPLRAMQVLTTRGAIRMTLERNPRKTSKLTRLFCDYFGLPLPRAGKSRGV